MNEERKIRTGAALLLMQLMLLAATLGFHRGMDRQAEQAGIAPIIQEAGR